MENNVNQEIDRLMEVSKDNELTMGQRCESLAQAICMMQNAKLQEDVRYHSALERYIIMVAEMVGSYEISCRFSLISKNMRK